MENHGYGLVWECTEIGVQLYRGINYEKSYFLSKMIDIIQLFVLMKLLIT